MDAALYVIIQDGAVVKVRPVRRWDEERADILILHKGLDDGLIRWKGIKVVGYSNPWGAYHIVEKWAAEYADIVEMHMVHTIIERYGQF